jgi:hypothetical protein
MENIIQSCKIGATLGSTAKVDKPESSSMLDDNLFKATCFLVYCIPNLSS